MFTTFCASFPNGISHFKILAMPYILCALFIANTNLREPRFSRSSEVGNTFLILSYSKANSAKRSFVWSDFTQ